MAHPAADLYGSDRMMLETVRGLIADGWEVVVTAAEAGPLTPLLAEAGARFVELPVPILGRGSLSPTGIIRLVGALLRALRPTLRLVREVRPHVLYVSTLTIPLWLAAGRLTRTPTVNHVHESESSTHAVLRFGLTLPTRLARLVVYNSEWTRQVALRCGGRARRSVVIHNGVEGPAEVVAPRAHVSRPRLVYVGRLSPRKGVDVAVDALARLRAGGLDATLDLVGAVFPGYEWYEQGLRDQVVHRGLDHQVRFLGFCREVWAFLADGDIVVVPSRREETFGNAAVEAALSARPVVVSDHSGLREAAAGRAATVLVEPDDPGALAGAIRGLVHDWDRTRELAELDAPRAAEQFGIDRYRRCMTEALDAVARPEALRPGGPSRVGAAVGDQRFAGPRQTSGRSWVGSGLVPARTGWFRRS